MILMCSLPEVVTFVKQETFDLQEATGILSQLNDAKFIQYLLGR
jgi:hypothetical protein